MSVPSFTDSQTGVPPPTPIPTVAVVVSPLFGGGFVLCFVACVLCCGVWRILGCVLCCGGFVGWCCGVGGFCLVNGSWLVVVGLFR